MATKKRKIAVTDKRKMMGASPMPTDSANLMGMMLGGKPAKKLVKPGKKSGRNWL